jgi:hypothetical protein
MERERERERQYRSIFEMSEGGGSHGHHEHGQHRNGEHSIPHESSKANGARQVDDEDGAIGALQDSERIQIGDARWPRPDPARIHPRE